MKANVLFVCILTVAFLSFKCINCASIRRRSVTDEQAQGWLRHYGYLTAANPTNTEYMDAVMTMQEYYNVTLSGTLNAATETMMQTPRCGIKDIGPEIIEANCTEQEGTTCRRRRFTTLGAVWDSTSLTYRFNNYSPDLSRTQIQVAIQRALGIWADVAPLSFSQKQDGNSFQERTDIEISFGVRGHGSFHPADEAFDGPSSQGGTVLAHAFNPGSTRFADLRGDMHFDDDEVWEDGAGIDLFTVAGHEFGHSLGLGHSNVRGALMFPTYFGFDPNFQLHDNDIQGIQSLYGVLQTGPDPTTPKLSTAGTTMSPTTPVGGTMSTPKMNQEYCQTSYDSIATFEYIFDGSFTAVFKMTSKYVARFVTDDTMVPDVFRNDIDSSSEIQTALKPIWSDSELPITAVVELAGRSLVVIRETNYWEYDATSASQSPIELKPTFPQPLSNLGLPNGVTIVAALSNRDQNEIYLFSADMFWSFDGNLGSLSEASPDSISGKWPGVPDDFGSAFSWQGNSYFVKESQYWLFNETTSEVGPGFPRSFSEDWLGCESSAYITSPSIMFSLFCLLLAFVLPK